MSRLKSSALRELTERRWGPQSLWRCVYCGRSAPDGAADHFIPRERGGTDLPWNLVPACGPCNSSKKDHEPIAWMRAVGVPDPTITALQTITRSPSWTRAEGFRFPTRRLNYRADDYSTTSDWLADADPALLLPLNLLEVFDLDPDAWAPVTAIRRVVADHQARIDRPPLSSQQLNRELDARGLTRTKRKGVYGYRGIRVSAEAATAGRLTAGPAATRAARVLTRDATRGRLLSLEEPRNPTD